MMNGEKPASCLKCYKEEDAGHRSKRQWETAKWVDEIGLDEILIDYNYETGEIMDLIEDNPDYTKAFAARRPEEGNPILLVCGRGGFINAFKLYDGIPYKVI